MLKPIDRKHSILYEGFEPSIIETFTGKVVPHDEPVVLLRASDNFNLRSAACGLVEVCVSVRRDGNTDEFMAHLCEAMNAICELIGEGDAVGYVQSGGRFTFLGGVKRGKP